MPYVRLSATEQTTLLDGIVARARAVREKGGSPVVVFDLDGTLMDNRPRTIRILHELAHTWSEKYPEASASLREAHPDRTVYALSETLDRVGVRGAELIELAETFWKERFFFDEHLVHDTALAGSVSFAKDCHEAGARLAYVTGRDLPNMSLGTWKSLRDLGFPIGVVGTELILKSDAAIPDEEFKRLLAPKLSALGEIIASFDNEPGNCNIFLKFFPQAKSVLVDTQHHPAAPKPDAGVDVIGDFSRSSTTKA